MARINPERQPRIIDVSPPTFREIQDRLLEAGYDFLAWGKTTIAMDGFILRETEPR